MRVIKPEKPHGYRRIFFIIAAIYVFLYAFPCIWRTAGTILYAFFPLLIGGMIAYVVNILMCFYEKGYAKICRAAAIAPFQRAVCMTLSYLSLVLILVLLWWMIVPQLLACVEIMAADFPQLLELLCEWTDEHLHIDMGMGNEIRTWMKEPFCMETLLTRIPKLAKGMKQFLQNLGQWFFVVIPGLMFSFYLLASKETLLRGSITAIDRCFGVLRGKKIRYVLTVVNHSFHRFLVGQTIEAVILGSLCATGMWLLGLPYAAMIGCLVGVTALLPVIGAYIGAAAGACMLLTVSPVKALVFLIFLTILQQIEGNVIYPRVVGHSIGLPGIWVLAAVIVGGGAFGIGGILFAVPLAAAAYHIIQKSLRASS